MFYDNQNIIYEFSICVRLYLIVRLIILYDIYAGKKGKSNLKFDVTMLSPILTKTYRFYFNFISRSLIKFVDIIFFRLPTNTKKHF